MPLDSVARRYADRLFQNSFEEILSRQQTELANVRADHVKRGSVVSGDYVAEHGRVYLDQIRQVGEVRANSLVKAYERARLPFDDTALHRDQVRDYGVLPSEAAQRGVCDRAGGEPNFPWSRSC